MEKRLKELLWRAIDMLIDEAVMFVDIMEGLNTNDDELRELGFSDLVD